MAAPTSSAVPQKTLANMEPSTHGTKAKCFSTIGLVRHEALAALTAGGRYGRLVTQYGSSPLRNDDVASLNVIWLKDKSLTGLDKLPEPDELAEEILNDLEASLDSF